MYNLDPARYMYCTPECAAGGLIICSGQSWRKREEQLFIGRLSLPQALQISKDLVLEPIVQVYYRCATGLGDKQHGI